MQAELEYTSHESYVSLVAELSKELGSNNRKRIRQSARSVLPNATETKVFVTANARAVRHFIEQRGSKAADLEIQAVAHALLSIMQQEAPNLFRDYSFENGEIVATYRKVWYAICVHVLGDLEPGDSNHLARDADPHQRSAARSTEIC